MGCIADYIRRLVDFGVANTENVSPLVRNKKRLDRIVMRSGVFVADMTCIALRSKNLIQNVWFRFDLALCSLLDREGVLVCATVARQKIAQDIVKQRTEANRGKPV